MKSLNTYLTESNNEGAYLEYSNYGKEFQLLNTLLQEAD